METFTAARELVAYPGFAEQRDRYRRGLDLSVIDMPIVDIIKDFAQISCCFTLQSCYGHFVYPGQGDRHNIEPLPASRVDGDIEYRIAYIALCIEDSGEGRELLSEPLAVPAIDTAYIQAGCAGWFWEQHVNSYAFQVEPGCFKCSDTAIVSYEEAAHIEKTRGLFFDEIRRILSGRLG